MKQAFIKKGSVIVSDIPEPSTKNGFIKIRVNYSTISAGTEMNTVKGSGKGIIRRALEDPAKVLQVLDIAKGRGIKSAKSLVESAISRPSPIGYSIAGRVIDIGEGVTNFTVGDLVAAGGSGFAVHAEVVNVPKNLVVKIPSNIDLISASTGTVGSIALHGVRRADLRLGEFGVVFGTGLLGLIALQMLTASGVKTACIDINANRLKLAKELGADIIINPFDEDPVLAVKNWTAGHGADAVLFMAATNQSEPLSQSFQMCRRKGKVVLVGASGMHIKREDIYKDEIDFLISTSYGPGRYDNSYELKGIDYPYAYVRWTENRNIAEYLELINKGKISLSKLKPVLFNINDIELAYKSLSHNSENPILVVLEFVNSSEKIESQPLIIRPSKKVISEKISIGLIGAGGFATNTLLPIIIENCDKFYLKTVVNSTGDKAVNITRQFKAEQASSNPADVFNDPDINLVVICTRHDNHAELVLKSLQHNKNVFVEKPLATNLDELKAIKAFYKGTMNDSHPLLCVGFNRRFSKYALEVKEKLNSRLSPLFIRYRMNAGFIPYDSWVHEHGGRIVGEACHIIDLFQFFTDSKISKLSINPLKPGRGMFNSSDNRSITFVFEDGSVAVLDYFSLGSKAFPKEFFEVHYDNKSIVVDDYKNITGYGVKAKRINSKQSNKGHAEEWVSIYDSMKNGYWPISLESLLHTTEISIIASK